MVSPPFGGQKVFVFWENTASTPSGHPRGENLWAAAFRLIVGKNMEFSTLFGSVLSDWMCCSTRSNRLVEKTWHKKCHREAPMAEKVGGLQQCIIASKGKRWYNRM